MINNDVLQGGVLYNNEMYTGRGQNWREMRVPGETRTEYRCHHGYDLLA